jgi:hypothetical protein
LAQNIERDISKIARVYFYDMACGLMEDGDAYFRVRSSVFG